MRIVVLSRTVKHIYRHTAPQSVGVSNQYLRTMEDSAAAPKREAMDDPVAENSKKLKVDSDDLKKPYDGPRWRTRKFAMMMVFSGKGYYGMQLNPTVPTIEKDLLHAIHKAGLVPDCEKSDLKFMDFQRASRTDKGVSAAGQIVSLKCWEVPDSVPKLNEHLPAAIRVLGMKRVTKGFDSKKQCSGRTYSYFMPTYAFTPVEQHTTEQYRVTPEVLTQVSELLDLYRGTHNFHNFTSGKESTEESAKRHILSFTCGLPQEIDGLEFVTLKVRGQSFMLHQIRKMIGLVIAIVRGFATREAIQKAQSPAKCDVPKAPGLGLVLEQVHFDAYNKRFGTDGIHEPLEWEEYEKEVETFKQDHIYQTIIETEKKERAMLQWLSTLTLHHFDYRIDVEFPSSHEHGLGHAHHRLKHHRSKLGKEDQTNQDTDTPGPGAEADGASVTSPAGTETAAGETESPQQDGASTGPPTCAETNTCPPQEKVSGSADSSENGNDVSHNDDDKTVCANNG